MGSHAYVLRFSYHLHSYTPSVPCPLKVKLENTSFQMSSPRILKYQTMQKDYWEMFDVKCIFKDS